MSTPQSRVGRFIWHENISPDADGAKSFYTQLLGWGIEIYKAGELEYPMIAAGGTTHGGFWGQDGAPPHWIGHVHVADVDAAAKTAESLGGTVLNGPMDMPEIGRFATIQDQQGAVISAYKPEGSSPAAEGVFVWDELYSPDVEASKRFYSEVFGWTTGERDVQGTAYTMFSSGDMQVAGVLEKPEQMPAAVWMPYLATDDVDSMVGKAGELGATAWVPGMDVPGIGRVAVLSDPIGAMFGLFGEPES